MTEQSNDAAERSASIVRGGAKAEPAGADPFVTEPDGTTYLMCTRVAFEAGFIRGIRAVGAPLKGDPTAAFAIWRQERR